MKTTFRMMLLAAIILLHAKTYTADPNTNLSTLVVGSTRAPASHEPYFTKALWDEAHATLTYQNAPHVITMDIAPAANPGTHIRADAAHVDAAQIPLINRIYLERPWTFDFTTTNIHTNTVAFYIKNLLSTVPHHTPIIIEWHPFIARASYYDCTKPFIENPVLTEHRTNNPFTGFFDTDFTWLATRLAIDAQYDRTAYAPTFIEAAQNLVPAINKLLDFYATQHPASREALVKRLTVETAIVDCIMKHNPERFGIAALPSIQTEEFTEKVDHIVIPDGKEGIQYISLNTEKTVNKTGIRYYPLTKSQFSVGTHYYFLWSDITVETNKPHAIQCLERLGLTNVTLERGTSPLNGRKNVWLLTGYKQ